MSVYDEMKKQYAAGAMDDEIAQQLVAAKNSGATDQELYEIAKAGYQAGKIDDAAAIAIRDAFFPIAARPDTTAPADATQAQSMPQASTEMTPVELAEAYQRMMQERGQPISYAEAERRVAQSPRAAYAEVMEQNPIMRLWAHGADVLSAPGRMSVGAIRGSVTDEPAIQAAAWTEPRAEGALGILEGIALSPATPLAPITGAAGMGTAARMLPAASKARQGALAGATTAGLEMGVEAADRAITGRDQMTLGQMAVGSLFGAGAGGAMGKFADMATPPASAPDVQAATTPRQAQVETKKFIESQQQQVPADVRKAYSEQLSSPRLAVGFVGKDGPTDIPYTELLQVAKGKPSTTGFAHCSL